MAPHSLPRSEHPGKPVALLYRGASHTPPRSERPGKPVALLYFSSQVFESVRLYSTGWMLKPFTAARAAMISFVV